MSAQHKIKIDNIPEELKALKRWVCWTERKRPITASVSPAAVNDPHTWCDFETAAKALSNPAVFGIGFVLGDGITGIDIDGGINEQGELSPLVADIVAQINSYTEVSPSGKGLHIIARADWPELMDKGSMVLKITGEHKEIAMFGRDRYFTVTGDIYGSYAKLSESQQAVDSLMKAIDSLNNTSNYVSNRLARAKAEALRIQPTDTHEGESVTQLAQRVKAETGKFDPSLKSDFELLDIGRKWTNGAGEKFSALYDSGDISGYASTSEADLALCNYLAYLTQGDHWRMNSLFRNSALYRPEKWDRRTYGEVTINKAVTRWLSRNGLFNS